MPKKSKKTKAIAKPSGKELSREEVVKYKPTSDIPKVQKELHGLDNIHILATQSGAVTVGTVKNNQELPKIK